MTTAQEVFTFARTLPLPERLRLAALILEDVTQAPAPVIDPQDLPGYSSEWLEEDLRDLAAHSARYIATQFPEDDDLITPPEEIERLRLEQANV